MFGIAVVVAQYGCVSLGPDHLSALAALSSGRTWQQSLALGIQWGCGHSLGIAVVAVIALVIGHSLDLGQVRTACNYLTGLFLIAVGTWTMYTAVVAYRAASSKPPPSEWSKVKCQDASYVQLQADDDIDEHHRHFCHCCSWTGDSTWSSSAAFVSVCMGLVHGVAGPGGMLGVLPVLAMHYVAPAVAFLLSFSLSSVLCMGAFAALYGEATRRSSQSSAVVALRVAAVSAWLSISVGIAWIVLQATGELDKAFGGEHAHH